MFKSFTVSMLAATSLVSAITIDAESKGKCPFGYDQQSSETMAQKEEAHSEFEYVHEIFDLEGAKK